MSVFSANIRHRSFWPQINLLCFVLGLLLAAAVHTTTQVTRAGVGTSNPGLSYGSSVQMTTEKIKEYEHEIKKKSEYATELENTNRFGLSDQSISLTASITTLNAGSVIL